MNNTCVCKNGWSGVSCHIPPVGAPRAARGDAGCGNWSVYGTLTLSNPGYAPTCDCSDTGGMTGAHCEVECVADADCWPGVCDTDVGRCVCEGLIAAGNKSSDGSSGTACYTDDHCPAGECIENMCITGWAGVGCKYAATDSCRSDLDCGLNRGRGEGGTCNRTCEGDDCVGVCACADGFTGLRCERELAGAGAPCVTSAECAGVTDVCVDLACALTGDACEEDFDCAQLCRDGVCATPADDDEEVSDAELGDIIMGMLDQLLTVEGIAQMAVEEYIIEGGIEWVGKRLATRTGGRRLVAKAARRAALRSARVAAQGAVTKAATTGAATIAVKQASLGITRAAVSKAMTKIATMGYSVAGWLLFALQMVGMVLDVDDAAGFNTQVPQGGVDMVMKKFLDTVNAMPELRDAGVQFPREYLPEYTTAWRADMQGDAVADKRLDLTLDYLDRLVINSNGKRIVSDWGVPATGVAVVTSPRNSALWAVAGKDAQVYAALSKWWWLILVLLGVVALTIGLGVGLTARKGRSRRGAALR